MRVDTYVSEVLERCEALKRANMWLPEPRIRPRAWIENFEDQDKILAAHLLERFVFYNQSLTDCLLNSSYQSISDGLSKGPAAPSRSDLMQALPQAVFTPVSGENPNPTDSGYFLCRRARQVLGVDESKIKSLDSALASAQLGQPIVFVDDFIGSGDQFLSTWTANRNGTSFKDVHRANNFIAVYISLVGAEDGVKKIWQEAPNVAVCVAHKVDDRGTFWGIEKTNRELYQQLDRLLCKYSARLRPTECYMYKKNYIVYGYKARGMFFGFEHSMPDATLPIFWSRGINNWEPLIERS